MDISETELDKHCYLNTVEDEETIFSITDQNREEAMKILQ